MNSLDPLDPFPSRRPWWRRELWRGWSWNWPRHDKLAALGILATLAGVAAGLFIPEIRDLIGLRSGGEQIGPKPAEPPSAPSPKPMPPSSLSTPPSPTRPTVPPPDPPVPARSRTSPAAVQGPRCPRSPEEALKEGQVSLDRGETTKALAILEDVAACPGDYARVIAKLFDPAFPWAPGSRSPHSDPERALHFYRIALQRQGRDSDLVQCLNALRTWAEERDSRKVARDIEQLLEPR